MTPALSQPLCQRMQCRFLISLVMAVGLVTAALPARANQAENLRVFYHATKFGIGVDYEIRIRRRSPEPADLGWMVLPQQQAQPTSDNTVDNTWVHVQLKRGFLGRSTMTDSLLLPATGAVIQRIVRRQRRDHTKYKASQFGAEGVRILRLRDDAPLSALDWTQARVSFDAHPDGFEDHAWVTDVSAIFFLLGREVLHQPGGLLEMPVFTDSRLMQLRLQAQRTTRVRSNYVEYSADTKHRRKEMRDALLVAVGARVAGCRQAPADPVLREVREDRDARDRGRAEAAVAARTDGPHAELVDRLAVRADDAELVTTPTDDQMTEGSFVGDQLDGGPGVQRVAQGLGEPRVDRGDPDQERATAVPVRGQPSVVALLDGSRLNPSLRGALAHRLDHEASARVRLEDRSG